MVVTLYPSASIVLALSALGDELLPAERDSCLLFDVELGNDDEPDDDVDTQQSNQLLLVPILLQQDDVHGNKEVLLQMLPNPLCGNQLLVIGQYLLNLVVYKGMLLV